MEINDVVLNDLKNFGIKPKSILKINKGVNSNSFCIREINNKWLLKFYKNQLLNNRLRLEREYNFLKFLEINSFSNVAKPLLINKTHNWILMSWIEGENIINVDNKSCLDLINFILKIQNFKSDSIALKLHNASEACFSINDHFDCIKKRIDKINKFLSDKKIKSHSNKFKLFEKLREIESKLKFIDQMSNTLFSNNALIKEIDYENRIISPSDIGFHNCMRNNEKLFFYDFEYAGWDDPLKLICDLILQPDHGLPIDNFEVILKFTKNIKLQYEWRQRLKLMFELYKIKWFSIILNPVIRNSNLINISQEDFIISKAIYYLEDINKKINNANELFKLN